MIELTELELTDSEKEFLKYLSQSISPDGWFLPPAFDAKAYYDCWSLWEKGLLERKEEPRTVGHLFRSNIYFFKKKNV